MRRMWRGPNLAKVNEAVWRGMPADRFEITLRQNPHAIFARVNGSFGFCRPTPRIALRAAKICAFVGITDLFCVATGLRMGGAIALGDCTRRIPEEPGQWVFEADRLGKSLSVPWSVLNQVQGLGLIRALNRLACNLVHLRPLELLRLPVNSSALIRVLSVI